MARWFLALIVMTALGFAPTAQAYWLDGYRTAPAWLQPASLGVGPPLPPPAADNVIDWANAVDGAVVPANGTYVPGPVVVPGTNGNAAAVASARIYRQAEYRSGAWSGDFLPGEAVLYARSGTLTITLDRPVQAVFGQIHSHSFETFTSEITALTANGEVVDRWQLSGRSGEPLDSRYWGAAAGTGRADGTAPPFFVTSHGAPIIQSLELRTWLRDKQFTDPDRFWGFGINSLHIVTPVPAALPLLTSGLIVVAMLARLRRRAEVSRSDAVTAP